MKLKSYFAPSIEAALESARQELGEDAMLMNSRQAPPEARHLGRYEVVFAAPAMPELPVPSFKGDSAAGGDGTANGIDELRRQMNDLRRLISQQQGHGPSHPQSSELAVAFQGLVQADVDPDVAQQILSTVQSRLEDSTAGNLFDFRSRSKPPVQIDRTRLLQELRLELEGKVSVDASIKPATGPSMLALVGPAGAGKTTTLVKLAVVCGLMQRRSVQILSIDNLRVGAAEQLRSFAAILGVGFEAVETPRALAQAVSDHASKSLILIDTPGYSAGDIEDGAGLAAFLGSTEQIDVHLVLSASMKFTDMSRAAGRFNMFRPSKLLFTKLDETGSFGTMFSQAAMSGRPVSFLCAGPSIPENIQAATKEALIHNLIPKEQAAGYAAA